MNFMEKANTQKAIFFDRDNTLIYDKGYMHDPADLKFFPDTIKTLKELQNRGYLLFIITNQSGIGRGYFSEKDMHNFHKHMLGKLKESGIQIQDLAFCPHKPDDNCDCRKPNPKMLNDFIEKYNIQKNLSYMVGDKESDVLAGQNAGLNSLKIENENIKVILEQIA